MVVSNIKLASNVSNGHVWHTWANCPKINNNITLKPGRTSFTTNNMTNKIRNKNMVSLKQAWLVLGIKVDVFPKWGPREAPCIMTVAGGHVNKQNQHLHQNMIQGLLWQKSYGPSFHVSRPKFISFTKHGIFARIKPHDQKHDITSLKWSILVWWNQNQVYWKQYCKF